MAEFFKFKQAGDTIIEVMAAIAIMGLALGAAYALSNRSFNTAQNTDDRVEALALAQGQAEFLRDLGLRNQTGSLLASYPDPNHPFCFIDRDDGTNVAGTPVVSSNNFCLNYGPGDETNTDSSHYDIAITYCDAVASNCGPINVFTIKATWSGAGGSQNNNLSVYYKPLLLSAAIPSPSPSPSPSPGPASCGPSNITVNFSDPFLSAANNTVTVSISPIAGGCGDTDFLVITKDDTHESGYQVDQINERLFIEGYNGANLVFSTVSFAPNGGLTDDIPEALEEEPTDFNNVPLPVEVNRLVFKHISIHPNCRAGFPLWPNCRPPPSPGSNNSIHEVEVQVSQTP